MKITKEALNALLRIVVGCRPPMGKEKRRQNEAHLVVCAKGNQDVPFDSFRLGLADGTEMYDSIAFFATGIGKPNIDLETIIKYFGGAAHISKTTGELMESSVNINSVFALQTLFSHLVVQLEIVNIDAENETFDGVYRNGEHVVSVKNAMFFSEDKKHILVGKRVLTHFPLYVSESNDELNEYLIENQASDPDFLKAIRFFSQVGLDHKKIPMNCKWIVESKKRYDL